MGTTTKPQSKPPPAQDAKPAKDAKPPPNTIPTPGPPPDTLFHTLLTVVDYPADPSGGTRSTWVLGTHMALNVSKAFAQGALPSLGYSPTDFRTYEFVPHGGPPDPTTPPPEDAPGWSHGDGYVVWAEAPAGQVFEINIEARPNTISLQASKAGTPLLPPGTDHLHYVLQTLIDYASDRSGAAQESIVAGTYAKRADAMIAAKGLLLKADFEVYEERDETDKKGEWEFGEDVVVHAVEDTGVNLDISVKTVPGAHRAHARRTASV